MKKLIYLFAILAFTMSCSSQKEESSEATEAETTEEESVFTYSGSFEMGDAAHQQTARALIDAYAAKDMESGKAMFGDSVTMYFASGGKFEGTSEELANMTSEYLTNYETVEITHLAGMSVNETTNNHQWALTWIAETRTMADGTTESDILHESWLFEDGKVVSMRQFRQEPNPADAPSGDEEPRDYTYSGSFTMGDVAHIDVVLGLNNAAQGKDMDGIANAFADSVTIIGHDGFYFNASRDSLMAMVSEWFTSIQEMTINYNAAMSVTSTDRNEDWVLLWYEDNSTNTEGENYHTYGHDDYLIVDGKIREIRGYVMKINEEGEEAAEEEVVQESASIIE